MGKNLMLQCRLCGAGTTRAQTSHVPLTPAEIAAAGTRQIPGLTKHV